MDHQKIRINRFWNFLRYLIIPFVLLFLLNYHVERTYLPPQTTFTFGEHCNYYGYPYEEYSVTTADGYILSIYRIPSTGKAQLGLPVLLIHGLSNSANCFIVNQCTTPPAFILADQNFDVWFGNCRGSHLSRGHTVYDATKDEEYWDWSFTELVLFDLPTFVNFVKNKTGHKKIGMLGHSQGAAAIM